MIKIVFESGFLFPELGKVTDSDNRTEIGGLTLTINEFANDNNVTEKTVLRRLKDIPGSYKTDNGEIIILEGSRFPYRRNKNILPKNAVRVVLSALSYSKYIDHTYVKISNADFLALLNQLENEGYIERNMSGNNYGANGYVITLRGRDFLDLYNHKSRLQMVEIIGTSVNVLFPR